jgi:WD40 repeat protein
MSITARTFNSRLFAGVFTALAVGACLFFRTVPADAQSQKVKRYKPALVVQSGHRGFVRNIWYSPDGKLIVSSDGSNYKLWDATTGVELRTLFTVGSSDGPRAITFSADSKYVIDGLRVIDVYAGTPAATYDIGSPVSCFITSFLSPDGKTFAAEGCDRVDVWNGATRAHVSTRFGKHVVLNGTRSLAASYGELSSDPSTKTDAAIHIYDLSSGREIAKLGGFPKEPKKMRFGPDGTRLVTVAEDRIDVWDVAGGRKVSSLPGSYAWIVAAELSAQNDTVLFYTSSIEKRSVNEYSFWKIGTSAALPLGRRSAEQSSWTWSPSAAFSPDGRYIGFVDFIFGGAASVVARGSLQVKILDLKTGQALSTFSSLPSLAPAGATTLAFEPGGASIAVGDINAVDVFDIKSGAAVRRFAGTADAPGVISLARDGQTIAVAPVVAHAWWQILAEDTAMGLPATTLWTTRDEPSPGSTIGVMTFNAPSTSTSLQLGAQLVNRHGRYLSTVFGMMLGKTVLVDGKVYEPTFNFSDVEKEVEVQPLIDFAEQHRKPDMLMYAAECADDGSKMGLLFGKKDPKDPAAGQGEFELWDVAKGGLLWRASTPSHDGGIRFSADARTIMTGGVRLFIETGKPVPAGDRSELAELADLGTTVINGRKVTVEIGATSVDLHDAATRELIAQLYSSGEDWAVVTPSGLFDGTGPAQEAMHFVVADQEIGYETIALDQLKSSFYVPGLLHKLFYASNDLPKVGQLSITLPPSVSADLKGSASLLNLELTNRGGGIGRVEVQVNGAEVSADARAAKNVDASAARASVAVDIKDRLHAGQNKVEVIAWNLEGNVRGRPAELYLDVADNGLVSKGIPFAKPIEEKKASEVNFYAIVSGIADYQGSGIDLRFSAKDAEDISKAVTLGARKYFCNEEMQAAKPCDRVHIRVLSTESTKDAQFAGLADVPDIKRIDPTKAGFKEAFAEVAAKAKPEDVVFVYMSGHGTSIVSDQAVKESAFPDMYLYPTRDASTLDREVMSNPTERDAKAVSSLELAGWLANIKADKRVMVLDTCSAGAVQKDLVSQARAVDALQVRSIDRLRERSGFYILMGTAADSQSFEANEFRQGLLTYSLIEAMTTDKGLREGKFLDVENWFGFAVDRVGKLAEDIGGVQKPSFFKGNLARTFDMGRIDPEEQRILPLAQRVPLILRPELRENGKFTDKEHLTDKLESKLIDQSMVVVRGQGPAVNYIRATTATNGLTPRGSYSVDGNNITIEMSLIRDENEVAHVKVTGTRDDVIGKLLEQILNAISQKQ